MIILPVLIRPLAVLTVLLATFAASAPATALVPRVAICGRVTSIVDPAPPADPIVRLGTQEPRRLILGGRGLQVGEEICIWGIDVENKNPPSGDPAPKGIVGPGIASVGSIGCATVIDGFASFIMLRQEFEPPQNRASLTLPLSVPAGGACVRLAVDAAGNPVAVVVPRAPSPSASAPAKVNSLPNTSTLPSP